MTTEDKEQGYFAQEREAFARNNESNLNAGTDITEVSLEYGKDGEVDQKLETSGSAKDAQNHIDNSTMINNTLGAIATVAQENSGIDMSKYTQEQIEAAKYHGLDDPSKLTNEQMKEFQEHEQADAEATKEALQAALGAVLGIKGALEVVNAVNSFDEQDKGLLNNVIGDVSHQGPMQCANCRDANSLPTFARTPTVPGISQQQYLS